MRWPREPWLVLLILSDDFVALCLIDLRARRILFRHSQDSLSDRTIQVLTRVIVSPQRTNVGQL